MIRKYPIPRNPGYLALIIFSFLSGTFNGNTYFWIIELTWFLSTVFLCSEFKLENIFSRVNFCRKNVCSSFYLGEPGGPWRELIFADRWKNRKAIYPASIYWAHHGKPGISGFSKDTRWIWRFNFLLFVLFRTLLQMLSLLPQLFMTEIGWRTEWLTIWYITKQTTFYVPFLFSFWLGKSQ